MKDNVTRKKREIQQRNFWHKKLLINREERAKDTQGKDLLARQRSVFGGLRFLQLFLSEWEISGSYIDKRSQLSKTN